MRRLIILSVVLLGSACSAQQSKAPQSAPDPGQSVDKQALLTRMKNHPGRSAEPWGDFMSRPLEDRFVQVPDEVIEYLYLDNQLNDFPEVPRAAQIDAAMQNEIRDVLRELPASLRDILYPKLAGLGFVEELGGSAYTESLAGGDTGFVLLDVGVMQRTANAWATWKENTPFAEGRFKVTMTIEDDTNDTRKNALRYVLLHELGHIACIGERHIPDWGSAQTTAHAKGTHFFPLSWSIEPHEDGERYASVLEPAFPEARALPYYAPPARRLPNDRLPAFYKALATTNLVTPYSAARVGDDFAEALVSYVHVVMKQRPWRIDIRDGEEVVQTLTACWNEPRCADKRAYMDALLQP